MNSTQSPELCFYIGGRSRWMIAYTPYHMISAQVRLTIVQKMIDPLLLKALRQIRLCDDII